MDACEHAKLISHWARSLSANSQETQAYQKHAVHAGSPTNKARIRRRKQKASIQRFRACIGKTMITEHVELHCYSSFASFFAGSSAEAAALVFHSRLLHPLLLLWAVSWGQDQNEGSRSRSRKASHQPSTRAVHVDIFPSRFRDVRRVVLLVSRTESLPERPASVLRTRRDRFAAFLSRQDIISSFPEQKKG